MSMVPKKTAFFASVSFVAIFIILSLLGVLSAQKVRAADCPIFPSDTCLCTCCNRETSSLGEAGCVGFCALKGGVRQWGSRDYSSRCAAEADCSCCWTGSASMVTQSACSVFCSGKGGIRQWGTINTSSSCRAAPTLAACSCCWFGATTPSEVDRGYCSTYCSTGRGGMKSWGSEDISDTCLSEPSAETGTCQCCWQSFSTVRTRPECSTQCEGHGGVKQWRSETFSCPPLAGTCECCWDPPEGSGPFTEAQCVTACQDKGNIKRWSAESSSINRSCLPRPPDVYTCTGDADCPEGQICADIQDGVGFCEGPGETAPEEPSEEGAPSGVLTGGLSAAAGRAGYEGTTIETIVSRIIYSVLGFAGIIFLGLMLFAGFTWMFARGNEQDIEKAKKMIEAAIIGLIVVFAAYAISYFLISRFAPSGNCSSGEIDCVAACGADALPDILCAPSAAECVCRPVSTSP